MKNSANHRTGDITCLAFAALFLAGFSALAFKLEYVQLDNVAEMSYYAERQSVRRVKFAGERGRILTADGTILAANRPTRAIVVNPDSYQLRTWDSTVSNILSTLSRLEPIIERPSILQAKDIRKHLEKSIAMPIIAWRDLTDEELARFSEHQLDFPGLDCEETLERIYPQGSFASHLIGYVGRDKIKSIDGDSRAYYVGFEMRGRAGLEVHYDSYLRGIPGEINLTVDARGFAHRQTTVLESQKGPDLVVSLDTAMQKAAEKVLEGISGACAAIDPRDGSVLVLASSPAYDPNDFVPVLRTALWKDLSKDKSKPLLNRATSGSYAPGSTFKTITAFAAMQAGVSPTEEIECSGAFVLGKMKIRCTGVWGHGPMNLERALAKSCNPYFCEAGMRAGTNLLIRTARKFGLGEKTGIDFSDEARGVVPDAEWKKEHWNENWYPGDLPQMSIGQGMLLVTPLQMARVAGAIGTGYLATPHLKAGEETKKIPLPFPKWQLDAVKKGMNKVVQSGTGKRAGERLNVKVAGKTGTAEVGAGATRRKNAWFIAYAPAENPTVALAIVIECGESGGATAAPKAREILKAKFGELAAIEEEEEAL